MNPSLLINRFLWLALPLLLAPLAWGLLDWAVLSAVFRPDLQACNWQPGRAPAGGWWLKNGGLLCLAVIQ